MGEKAVGSELSWANLRGAEGLTLFNVYVPMNNGKTTEIDLLYITKVGIFVIESKNYKGWIFGTDTNKNWTEVLYTRKTWTNPNGSEKHINWLKRYLNINVPMFSLSVFSNNC